MSPKPTPSYCYKVIFELLDADRIDAKRLVRALLDDMDDEQVVAFFEKYGLDPR